LSKAKIDHENDRVGGYIGRERQARTGLLAANIKGRQANGKASEPRTKMRNAGKRYLLRRRTPSSGRHKSWIQKKAVEIAPKTGKKWSGINKTKIVSGKKAKTKKCRTRPRLD